MLKQLIFHDKSIDVTLSEPAVLQSEKLNSTLLIEIQVYFSCLLGKRLVFYTEHKLDGAWQLEAEQFSSMLAQAQPLTNNVFVRFNTVMTKSCPVSDTIGPPPVTDFKIKNQKPYVPGWLNIGFDGSQWFGEYGWDVSEVGQSNTKQVRG